MDPNYTPKCEEPFKDVIVVGCPSMTMNGRGHRVEKADALNPGSPIAYNVQTNNLFGSDLVADAENHFDATYMPQDLATLEMMLWGTTPYSGHDERLPLSRSHSQFSEAKAQFHLDAPVWIQRMKDMSFSFGPRIHGNVAAILAGTPGLVLAHDGRTLELSRFHGVPTIDLTAEECPTTVAELYARADFTEFNRGHAERFDVLSNFIHENGFTHIYDPGQERALADYEHRLSSIDYPDPQTSLWHDVPPEFVRMASMLQNRYLTLKKTQKAIRASGGAELSESRLREVEYRLAKAEAALGKTQDTVRSVRSTADRADRRVDKMMKVPLGLKKLFRGRKEE